MFDVLLLVEFYRIYNSDEYKYSFCSTVKPLYNGHHRGMKLWLFRPVKILIDPPQIVTQGFSSVL